MMFDPARSSRTSLPSLRSTAVLPLVWIVPELMTVSWLAEPRIAEFEALEIMPALLTVLPLAAPLRLMAAPSLARTKPLDRMFSWLFAAPAKMPTPEVPETALPTVPAITMMLLFELARPSPTVPEIDVPTVAPASIVTVLLPPSDNTMLSLLADTIEALLKTLIELFTAPAKVMPEKVGSLREVKVPSPMLTATPLAPNAV
ncbi:hypothetical protein ACKWRH_09205 [Bradyrhizobium sp. Pa8]|uniref:hypothetical protein n=1 Tax=Bradyrhizobium sp. Pa8 TaxID=3386552 RepID=UPI00403F7352